MTLTLDPATEQLLQSELERGRFADANELIAHALHLVQFERAGLSQTEMDEWLPRNKEAVRKALGESLASHDRGEGYCPVELKAHFAQRRATHAA